MAEVSKIVNIRVTTSEAYNSTKNQKREELIEQKSSVDSLEECLDYNDDKLLTFELLTDDRWYNEKT